jgi:hypothetical protein
MCSSDISLITWSWREQEKEFKADADTIHTCRDFEEIREWARNNQAGMFTKTVHVQAASLG